MDDIKDIQPHKNLSRFFDGVDLHTSPFGQNQSLERLYRRAERILGALFLATNHIGEREALRDSIRSTGLDMLRNVLDLREEIRSSESRSVSSFRESLRYLISLLRMAAVGGFVSEQNVSVLVGALDDVGAFLGAARNSPLSEAVSFSRQDFLDVGPTIKDVKDRHILKDTSGIKDTDNASNKVSHKSELDVRKRAIVEILRAGGELGIRDIASNLPEYSGKMIQRDLAELVGLGRVKKAGLKRWSRYSLA